MDNPWSNLPLEPPYVIPQERDSIFNYNESALDKHKFHLELLPEPYVGNPKAEIVLLNLNPGFSEHDATFYADKKINHLWKENLLHKKLDFPFYMLDPSIPQHTAGPKWWSKKLKEPINLAGRKIVSQRFCCIEYFPYHSRRFGGFRTILPSQKYNFQLVESAIDRKSIIILMRSSRLWFDAVPNLKSYDLCFKVNSWQNPAISKRNCPDSFPLITEILEK